MSTSTDLNEVLNHLISENQSLKLLLLSVLREKSVDTLNRYILETEVRTNLAVNNSKDPEGAKNTQKAGNSAISTLRTIVAEKSASL